jgi:hypothetical protein
MNLKFTFGQIFFIYIFANLHICKFTYLQIYNLLHLEQ